MQDDSTIFHRSGSSPTLAVPPLSGSMPEPPAYQVQDPLAIVQDIIREDPRYAEHPPDSDAPPPYEEAASSVV